MTVVGIDDTDSRTEGMCTTYAAHRVAQRLRSAQRAESDAGGVTGQVRRVLLVRLNPAVEHKTRGNAALAVHTDADPDRALELAREVVEGAARTGDERTNPGVVVAPGDPTDVPESIAAFAREAIGDHHRIDDVRELLAGTDYRTAEWGNGRGLIGALAAVGAWRGRGGPQGDWTHERIAYREPDRWGTPRDVDLDSVFAAADRHYPAAWDTVDRVEGEAVCVPHTPGPILFGIRGDDPDAVGELAAEIESEPVHATERFLTNQGTDDHLRDGSIRGVEGGRAYRVPAVVASPPETREGGHVFLDLVDPGALDEAGVPEPGDRQGRDRNGDRDGDPDRDRDGDPDRDRDCDPDRDQDRDRIRAAAFEPTKRFRDRVRALRVGDRVTACGEVSAGTLKLEKFAVRELRRTEPGTPECPDCGRRMESAGTDQGYRCRECGTTAPGKVDRRIDRDLERGWYEVPPCARRHVAKPLVRGGFDAPTHPER